jgi:metal-dependent amidase/aminoacylase/carboxypeptidase family protein
VTANAAEVAARVTETAVEMLGADAVPPMAEPLMGAEDFSYVLERVPGAMAWIGARPAGVDPDEAPPNHSNLAVFDEAPLPAGAALYAAMALRALPT